MNTASHALHWASHVYATEEVIESPFVQRMIYCSSDTFLVYKQTCFTQKLEIYLKKCEIWSTPEYNFCIGEYNYLNYSRYLIWRQPYQLFNALIQDSLFFT